MELIWSLFLRIIIFVERHRRWILFSKGKDVKPSSESLCYYRSIIMIKLKRPHHLCFLYSHLCSSYKYRHAPHTVPYSLKLRPLPQGKRRANDLVEASTLKAWIFMLGSLFDQWVELKNYHSMRSATVVSYMERVVKQTNESGLQLFNSFNSMDVRYKMWYLYICVVGIM